MNEELNDLPVETQTALVRQEHRLIPAIWNLMRFRKDRADPRRRASILAILWILLGPGTLIVVGSGAVAITSLVITLRQTVAVESQNAILERDLTRSVMTAESAPIDQAWRDAMQLTLQAGELLFDESTAPANMEVLDVPIPLRHPRVMARDSFENAYSEGGPSDEGFETWTVNHLFVRVSAERDDARRRLEELENRLEVVRVGLDLDLTRVDSVLEAGLRLRAAVDSATYRFWELYVVGRLEFWDSFDTSRFRDSTRSYYDTFVSLGVNDVPEEWLSRELSRLEAGLVRDARRALLGADERVLESLNQRDDE